MAYNGSKKPTNGGGGKGVKKYPADKNFTPSGDRPVREGKGAEGKPYDKKPHDKKPYDKKPYDKKPYGDRPREDYKTHEKKQDDRYEDREEDGNTPDPEAEGLVIGRNAVRELLRSDRTVDKLLVRRGDREGSIVVLEIGRAHV